MAFQGLRSNYSNPQYSYTKSKMDGFGGWKIMRTITILFVVIVPLLIFILQFYNLPGERFFSAHTGGNISNPIQEGQNHLKNANITINPVKDNDTTIASATGSNSGSSGNTSFPTKECVAQWFPVRHWTRPTKYSPHVNTSSPGEQMFGTLAAQRAIWEHQHPSTCHDKKFIVYEALGPGHGIGSLLHVISVALQIALNLDRILVLYPQPSMEWVKGGYCNGMDTLDECYFEPLSSCTIFDAFGGMDVSNESSRKLKDLTLDSYRSNTDRVLRSGVNHGIISYLRTETPHRFHSLLQSGGISNRFYYWWRAQSTAYIVRPNLRTSRELDRRRGLIFEGHSIEPGTISVHVRHGDKWKESELADDGTYLKTAESLIERFPDGLQRKIFLSTEDPNTVKFFANLTDWEVEYTNVSRDGSDRNMSPMEFAERIGWDEEFLNSLLSLQLALECDGFVGQISSNWNRLIDELRSTIRCKHHRVYVDVVQGFTVSNYDW